MSASGVLPPHWTQVIDRIHEAIRTALETTELQEQRLASLQPEGEPKVEDDRALTRLHQRLEAMQACCAQASQRQAEAEAALADAADRLIAFLGEVNPAARTLAEAPDRAVS